jgi:hypothetical protein
MQSIFVGVEVLTAVVVKSFIVISGGKCPLRRSRLRYVDNIKLDLGGIE